MVSFSGHSTFYIMLIYGHRLAHSPCDRQDRHFDKVSFIDCLNSSHADHCDHVHRNMMTVTNLWNGSKMYSAFQVITFAVLVVSELTLYLVK